MLNFITKTVRPILAFKNLYNSSQPHTPFIDQFDEELFKQQSKVKRSQTIIPYPSINQININHHETLSEITKLAQITTSHSIQAISPKILQKSPQAQVIAHFSGSFQKDNYNKFSRKMDIAQQSINAEELGNLLSILLKDQQKKQFSSLIKSFLKEEGLKQGPLPSKVGKKQTQLFKKVYEIFLLSIKEISTARKVLKLFSETHPILINLSQIKRDVRKKLEEPQQFKNHMKIDLYQYDEMWLPKKEEKVEIKKHNQYQRLSVKKWDQNTEYEINDSVVQMAEKKIFGNKKIVEQNIVFKRTDQTTNRNYDEFGSQWVYAYDLPYSIPEQEALDLKNMISERYGIVQQMFVDRFSDFVERDNINYIFEVPDNFKDENKRKRVKLNKVVRPQQKQVTPNDKSLLSKIIRKNLMYKSQSFNKSTILFKFQHKQNKMKFLTSDLRLYGMCFNKMKNIRFEEALSKNVILLSMIRWGAQSQHLIGHINNILQTLSIKVKHQKCIITKGSVLIEMNNFYEAYHAKNFLHNSNFQNQKIKAQLCYGSSCIHNGEYKYTFESNHYQKLLSDLKDLQEEQRKRLTE